MAPGAGALLGGVNSMFGGVMAVTGTSGMSVNVNTGLVYMPNSSAFGGMYAGYNSASYNVVVPASNSSQWRRDYIAAVMTDVGTSGAAWDVVDVAGTFSGSAPGTLPSLPANSVPLAIVNVVPNMTVTSGGGTVQDARQYQPLPGPWPTTSANKPPLSAPEGTLWIETDTNLLGCIIAGAYYYVPLSPTNISWFGPASSAMRTTNSPLVIGATPAADSVLTVPLVANGGYEFRIHVIFSGTIAGGFKCALTAPAGATGWWGGSWDTTGGGSFLSSPAAITGSFTQTIGSNGGLYSLRLSGSIVTTGTAGNLTINYSENGTSTGASLKAGSLIVADRRI